ncbi:DUF4293 domain-containing protein [Dysgonomonas mossii]|uniref:DUF4293 family protein n=1 Tax=Dysgonomonas mossii TaxID=163665 RepID=A0A4Y9IIF2_9BACT|nr:DUF4293 domain-containing protein [Dysgonomonas mossii]MBF0762537.1 DUF4293 domain-containing protein [Dysgonomonas mossii]TFU86941.1 DUF4293 family protein [Dysgonomonas mossii]
MIQRIQSIFLLLTTILMGATFVIPSLEITSEGLKFSSILFNSLGIFDNSISYHAWGAAIFCALSAIVAFLNIFLYNKRKLQIKLGLFTALLIAIYYVTAAFYVSAFLDKITPGYSLNIQLGIIFPVLALIFDLLAVSRIKKDEKLVKSLDRIR